MHISLDFNSDFNSDLDFSELVFETVFSTQRFFVNTMFDLESESKSKV